LWIGQLLGAFMGKKIKKEDKIKLIDIKTLRFAPEVEVELPAKADAQKLIARGRTLKGWEIKCDGSLKNGIELSPENKNHLYYNEESLTQIKEVLALVKVHKGYIDKKTCGLHIHVNVSKLTDKQILTIIKEWVHRQRYIVKRFKIHPERLEHTCQLLPKVEVHKLTEKQIHQFRNNSSYSFNCYSYIENKYYSLNVNHLPKNNYQTIEFRLFSGTLSFKEIKSAVYFVLTFMRDSLERE
jgi:hypothetical protein